MDRGMLAEYIGRERGVMLDSNYYCRVGLWMDWWKGFVEPFHRFKELDGAGGTVRRQLYSMRMAKKICEDWAGILLNERTQLVLHDAASGRFLQGERGDGGVLGACRFWQRVNALVEMAFCSGTGAIVLRLWGMRCDEAGRPVPDARTRIGFEFLPGTGILPLTVADGEITEAAFCSEVLEGGRRCVYLETHTLEQRRYVIENRYLTQRGGKLCEETPPAGIAPRIVTGSERPLFTIVRPNTVSTLEEAPGMGEAVFAHALDNLMGLDLAYNNFCRDFQLGGKKVFVNRSLLCVREDGALLAPDDVCKQLFVSIGERMPGDEPLIYEHNPALRVEDNVRGIQAQLDYLSLRCGLGAKYYRFDGGQVVTATQYAGDRQELMRSALKHSVLLKRSIEAAARMTLWAGRAVLGQDVREDGEIAVLLDDSIVTDRESQRESDRADVSAGLMQKWEYRMRWYGENEAAARAVMANGDAG